MSQREVDARYNFGLSRTMLRALNDDLSRPEYNNIIGGAGPFDFSGVTSIAAVPISLKVNNSAVVNDTIDLSAALVPSAVTVDEFVTAFNDELFSGWTASKDETTGRLKLVNSTTGAYVQVYGEAARLAKIGQGKGVKAIKSDTMQTFTNTPTMKEDTTVTVTDANTKDTEVTKYGYKKGFTGSLVDTAEDFEILELVESGTLSADGKTYTDPDSTTKKVVFEIETYNPMYAAGSNIEDQIVAWEHKILRMCMGSVGEQTKEAGFGTRTYNITGTNYRPRVTGAVESGAIITERLDLEDWSPEAFDAI